MEAQNTTQKLETNTNLSWLFRIRKEVNYQVYFDGDKFRNIMNDKIGTVKRLRDDRCEKSIRQCKPSHYCYSVDYEDGSFETYENQYYMEPL